MKTIRFLLIFFAAILFLTDSAAAQRRKPPIKRPVPKAAIPVAFTTDINSAKEKVSNQITNVTRFNSALGPIAQGIQDLDAQAKTKKLDKKASDLNEANKRKVIQAIRNLRAGLAALEVEFRTKPALKRFLLKIQGITDLSAQSEDAAFAGRFTDSGKPLLLVVEKLSNTLAVMP